jgi:hypothetical protein
LYRLRQDHQSGKPEGLALYGYARNNELVADFVKNLSASFVEADLVRAGTPLRSESLVPATRGSSSFITFQISVRTSS